MLRMEEEKKKVGYNALGPPFSPQDVTICLPSPSIQAPVITAFMCPTWCTESSAEWPSGLMQAISN